MKFRARVLLIVMWVVILLPQLGYAQERIASWNIQHLGWNNGKDFAALGVVGSHFDFIAVQEVMNEEGIERFRRALEGATGAEWLKTCSHLVGRGSYREMYCFTWRTDRFVLEGGEAVFIDSRDVFAREPFSAVFQSASGFRFVATSIHAIYGNSVAQRQAEAQALRGYYDWLSEAFPDLPILLMGDFNLEPGGPEYVEMTGLPDVEFGVAARAHRPLDDACHRATPHAQAECPQIARVPTRLLVGACELRGCGLLEPRVEVMAQRRLRDEEPRDGLAPLGAARGRTAVGQGRDHELHELAGAQGDRVDQPLEHGDGRARIGVRIGE